MVKKSYSCNYCQRPTVIRRGYSMALMIACIVLFWPAAIVYYFQCHRQCQACGGKDIMEHREGGDSRPAPSPYGGPQTPPTAPDGGAPVK